MASAEISKITKESHRAPCLREMQAAAAIANLAHLPTTVGAVPTPDFERAGKALDIGQTCFSLYVRRPAVSGESQRATGLSRQPGSERIEAAFDTVERLVADFWLDVRRLRGEK